MGKLLLEAADDVFAFIIEHTIDIPRIIVVPRGEVRSGFNQFTLDLATVRLQPVAQDILIQHLRTNERERLSSEGSVVKEPQLAARGVTCCGRAGPLVSKIIAVAAASG